MTFGTTFLGGILTAVLMTGFYAIATGLATGRTGTGAANTGAAGVAKAAPPVRLYKSAATLGSLLFC